LSGTTAPGPAVSEAQHHALLSELAEAAVDVCARHAWRMLVPRFGLPQNEGSRDAGEYPPEGAIGRGTASGAEGGAASGAGVAPAADALDLSGAPELSGFAVMALGKLGSREMRFGSDLDLVFVYRGEGTTTKGRSHWEFYTKLAQKLTALLTAPTQFGVLLELDHRLRPFGGKGLLVPSLAGYESFLAQEAEVWNFQSFTRARHLCGEPALSAAVLGRVARAWLLRRTPPQDVAREVFAMAKRLAAQSPVSAPGRIQLKYAVGGMLGFEFLRQCHFLLRRQTGEADALDPQRAELAALAGWWTPPGDHEIIVRLTPDYDALSALDERVSFYVEPYRHEVGPETFSRFAGVGRRWHYEKVLALCDRMRTSLEGAFRHLGG
jgi:glutamine synthetase adenylyltransferase